MSSETVDGRSLSETIRGARLGYGWCAELAAYVLIADAGPDSYLIDVRPPGDVPRRLEGDQRHRVWWSHKADRDRIGRTLRRVFAGDLRRVRVSRRIIVVVPGGIELSGDA